MKKWFFGTLAVAMWSGVYAQPADAASITEWLTIKGDVRNRFEFIDRDGRDERERFRIRARLAIEAQASEELDVKFRLASGSEDPVSANQTFDDGFSTKDFRLDRAYVDYHPDWLYGAEVWAGKMKQPWIRIQELLWDGDLNPEGFAIMWEPGTNNEHVEVFLHGGAFLAEERSSDDESWLFSAQGALKLKPTENYYLQGGGGLFAWVNLEDFPVLGVEDDDSFGNTATEIVDPDTGEFNELIYDNDFTQIELFAVLGIDSFAVPLKAHADFVFNTEADDEDFGFDVGVSLGKTKEPGTWAVKYLFKDVKANAVVGAFTDSDFGGGGTNVRGHEVGGKYQLAKNWQFGASLFFNDIDPDGSDESFFRTQIDLIAKF